MKVSDADKWFFKTSEQEMSRLEEEQEEGLEDEMDESVTTHNGSVTVYTGSYGTSYRDDDEAVCNPLNPYILE